MSFVYKENIGNFCKITDTDDYNLLSLRYPKPNIHKQRSQIVHTYSVAYQFTFQPFYGCHNAFRERTLTTSAKPQTIVEWLAVNMKSVSNDHI